MPPKTHARVVAQLKALDLRRADTGKPIDITLPLPTLALGGEGDPKSVALFNSSWYYVYIRSKKEGEVALAFINSIIVIETDGFLFLRQDDGSLSVTERSTGNIVASYDAQGKPSKIAKK